MAGIYLHIPFCKQACNYCNFHFSTSLQYKNEMIAAMVKEIFITPQPASGNENIDTVYFGGGTPSLLTVDDLLSIFDALKNKFLI